MLLYFKKKLPTRSLTPSAEALLFFSDCSEMAHRWQHSIKFRINVAWKHGLTEKAEWNWTAGLQVFSPYFTANDHSFFPAMEQVRRMRVYTEDPWKTSGCSEMLNILIHL